jgi:hypothetical protein
LPVAIPCSKMRATAGQSSALIGASFTCELVLSGTFSRA